MNIGLYIVKRLLAIIPTLLGISVICFVLINVAPGGPVEQRLQQLRFSGGSSLGASASNSNLNSAINAEVMESLKRQYGWDKPVHVRYWIWLKKLVRLDFGESFVYYEPVTDIIMRKLPVSLTFGLVSFFLVYLVCIPLGVVKALKDGTRFDATSSLFIFFTYSIPSFVVAILLIFLFGPGNFDWFPIGGLTSELYETYGFWEKLADRFIHAILPLFCYIFGSFALLTQLMKNSMLEEIRRDYVRTARAKGLAEKKVVFRHVLRNALIPVAVGFGGILSVFFAGSILLESIFNLDGIGLLGFQSALSRDVNVMMGLIVIESFAALLGVLLSDLTLVLLDPRIDLSQAKS